MANLKALIQNLETAVAATKGARALLHEHLRDQCKHKPGDLAGLNGVEGEKWLVERVAAYEFEDGGFGYAVDARRLDCDGKPGLHRQFRTRVSE